MPPSAILYISPLPLHNHHTSTHPASSTRQSRTSRDHLRRHGTTIEHLLASLSAPRPARSAQVSPAGTLTTSARRRGGTTAVLTVSRKRFAPAVDVKVEGDVMTVECDVPGIHKKDLNVELSRKHLKITGKRPRPEDDDDEEESESEERGWLERGRRWGKFSKSVELPEGSNPTPEGISAKLRSGVLHVEVELHKQQPAQVVVPNP